jgi:hypothetical protein
MLGFHTVEEGREREGGGMHLSHQMQKGTDLGAHARTSGARASARELFRRLQCGAGARRTILT